MVNDLTLILLTWRKWCAPNNASKEQMGFNSAFKGLIRVEVKKKRNKVQKFQAVGRSACTSLCTVFNVVVEKQE